MNKFDIGFMIILIALASGSSWAGQCNSIPQLQNDSSYKTGYVQSTGSYCLSYDIVQGRVFDIHSLSFKAPGTALVEIEVSDIDKNQYVQNNPDRKNIGVDVNLMGHVLASSDIRAIGIRATGGTRYVSVHDGKIDLSGVEKSLGISLQNEDGKILINTAGGYAWKESLGRVGNEDVPISKTIDKNRPNYKETKNIIDNMTISATERAVVMGGAGNVLRNSTIEVHGNSAIFLYGPGTIVENNTIIVAGDVDAKPFDAAIKLRDAKGAVVRNNRIIYKGGWGRKGAAAINLHDSPDVVIEGNTVEDFRDLVRVVGESNAIMGKNTLK